MLYLSACHGGGLLLHVVRLNVASKLLADDVSAARGRPLLVVAVAGLGVLLPVLLVALAVFHPALAHLETAIGRRGLFSLS